MAISARAVGAWAASNATSQTVTLPTHQAGDMLIVRAACKPFSATPSCSTSGWNALTARANGSTGNGNGTGSVKVIGFWKVATSSSETDPQVDWGTTSAPGCAVAVSYQLGAGESWDTPLDAGGPDTTADTSFSATCTTHLSVTAGDLVDFFAAVCDDTTMTVPTITQTGVTYNTVTEYPATALASTTSNDISADGGYRIATAGTSSAAAVITGTLSTSETGTAYMIRLRVVSVTAVGKDLQLVYNQRAAVGNAVQSIWNMRAPVGKSLQSVFHVRAGVGKVLQSVWNQKSLVGKSLQAVFNVAWPTGSYPAEVLADSPRAYYRLGEASGNPQDSSGNGNHVTAVGGTPSYGITGALTTDSDTAVSLDGSTEYFTAPDHSSLDLGDVFTLDAWIIRGPTGAERGIVSKGYSAYYMRVNASGYLQLLSSSQYELATSTIEVPGTGWHHVAASRDDSAICLYIDGVDVTAASPDLFHAPIDNTHPLTIGADGNGTTERFNGSIDEVAVYPTVLSPTRILAHYNAGAASSAVGKVLQVVWNMRAPVGKSVQTVWNVRSVVGKSVQAAYNVRATVNKTLQARFNLRSSAGKSLQSVFNVRSAVGKSVQAQFRVRSVVGKAVQAQFRVRSSAGKAVQAVWNDRAIVGRTLGVQFAVRQVVGASAELQYRVRGTAQAAKYLIWHVAGPFAPLEDDKNPENRIGRRNRARVDD